MARIGRNARSSQFVTRTGASRSPRTSIHETVTIRDERSGRELPLKGYGALKGQFAVKPGLDLSKPIAEQAGRTPPKI